MASLPLAGRKFARSMGEHLAHRGRPCSNATELCEGVEGPHVSSGALSSPPSASKASQVDTNTYSTIYPRLGCPDSKDSISLKSSLDSAFNLQWDGRKAKSHLPFSQSPSNKKSSLIGRSPRVPFTRNQVEGLEAKFRLTNYLSSREVTMLANQLQVTEARSTNVPVWGLLKLVDQAMTIEYSITLPRGLRPGEDMVSKSACKTATRGVRARARADNAASTAMRPTERLRTTISRT
ncbi:Homeobox protein MSX-2 [Taenia solium]|eukprot:TsM_000851900 transcript=TsM_000851900 gene=TsM_000851900